jgi:UDP-GlcNAc:undecaprenyl-phosphate GlcNAc-1-phosphate transferase
MRHLAAIELRETGALLLTGLRRPTNSSLKALFYPFWDMVWLAGSLALILWVFEKQRENFLHSWFMELPIWVSPTFLFLAVSRTYVTYWPRARLRDVLMVVFWLQTGILLSLGLALIINPDQRSSWLLRAVLIMGISHPVIMASRLAYRCLEEIVLWLKRQADEAGQLDNAVLFGAGTRAQLYLKDRAVKNAKTPDKLRILGFIDDEKSLQSQWVYGFLVLGGLKDLPRIINQWKISRVIIVADLKPESISAVCDMAAQHGIRLFEWRPEEYEVTSSKAAEIQILNKN